LKLSLHRKHLIPFEIAGVATHHRLPLTLDGGIAAYPEVFHPGALCMPFAWKGARTRLCAPHQNDTSLHFHHVAADPVKDFFDHGFFGGSPMRCDASDDGMWRRQRVGKESQADGLEPASTRSWILLGRAKENAFGHHLPADNTVVFRSKMKREPVRWKGTFIPIPA
jgi:hypothetical protein